MMAESMTSIYQLTGVDCAEEARQIENRLRGLPGLDDLWVDVVNGRLTVRHQPPVLSEATIRAALRQLGYLAPTESEQAVAPWLARENTKRALLIVSGVLLVIGWALGHLGGLARAEVAFFIPAILAGGAPIARKGLLAARQMRLDMNFLLTIAVLGAVAIGEWDEGATVVFLFALAQVLETYSMDRARSAIRALMELSPDTALVQREGEERVVPVQDVQVGETLVIRPGEKIPLDGTVTAGASTVNQAPITGESMPVSKEQGDEVFAGTLNQRGSLEVEVTRLSGDSTLARIIHMVEEAQAQRAGAQTFVDRFASYYTPTVIALAVLIAAAPPLVFGQEFSVWFYRALVLLVISCPCALVISTPVTIVSALANAARNGVLIKGGLHLENTGRVKAIVFDKTGTLTEGAPQVTDIIPLNDHTSEDLLRVAASLESRSEHPLGAAIVERARDKNVVLQAVERFEAVTGKGVKATLNGRTFYLGSLRLFQETDIPLGSAQETLSRLQEEGKTAVLLGADDHVCGVLAIADQVRPAAPGVIAHLRQCCGAKVAMLTGDNEGTARAIARQLEVEEYKAQLLPQDKVQAIKDLLARYRMVAMVGDGVNDAPALATATVGVAMGTAGTDTALETADIALMADDLSKLPFTIHLSRRALGVIKQNITLSIGIKALFLALAVVGKATLWMAVAADMGASMIVILNGLRLLRDGRLDPPSSQPASIN